MNKKFAIALGAIAAFVFYHEYAITVNALTVKNKIIPVVDKNADLLNRVVGTVNEIAARMNQEYVDAAFEEIIKDL